MYNLLLQRDKILLQNLQKLHAAFVKMNSYMLFVKHLNFKEHKGEAHWRKMHNHF